MQTRPDAFLPDLAITLNNISVHLYDLGRGEEALAASREAVDIYRNLVITRPDAFLPSLAMSVNNLGDHSPSSVTLSWRWPHRKRLSISIEIWRKPAATPSCQILR